MNISPWAVILALPLALAAAAGEEAPSLSAAVSEPASTMDAPSAPDELDLAVDRWPIVGKARLKVLFWEVYDSVLFTPSGDWVGEPPYRLSLHYLRDIPVNQLVEETDKAWRQQGREHPLQARWLGALSTLWPDISAGDSLVFGLNADGQNLFWYNGVPIGGIDDKDFGPLFGGIWLDPDTPRPALRAQLVGADSN